MPARAADDLQTPVQYLKGVGPRRAGEFAAAGVRTVEDLLLTLPHRYEDRARLQPIRDLRPGETTSISGTVLSCGLRNTRRPGFRILEMLVQDASGRVRVAFLNQAFLKNLFTAQQRVVLHGRVDRRPTGGLQITNPDYEVVSDESDDDGAGALDHFVHQRNQVFSSFQGEAFLAHVFTMQVVLEFARRGDPAQDVAFLVGVEGRPPAHPLQALGIAVAAVGAAGCHQAPGHRAVTGHALRLDVGAVPAADAGALVPAQAEPGQVVIDVGERLGIETAPVGVLDAQHVGAAGGAREQVYEQGGTDVADVQPAGRRRSVANPQGHNGRRG